MPQYGTITRFGTRFAGILALLALLLVVVPAQAQVTSRLQSGLVTGLVRDAETGQPVRYALVLVAEQDARAFTSEAGRFSLSGIGPGEYSLQVRQIGYAPLTVLLRVVREDFVPAPAPLIVEVRRQALVLPEVTVTATVCLDPRKQEHSVEAQTILDQAVTNGERLLAMAKEYPLESTFAVLRAGFTAQDSALWFRWDTLTSHSEETEGYRRGRVTVNRTGRPAVIQYFLTSDIAKKEFRDNHCLWVRGEEVLDSVRVIRIDFAPGERVGSTDWSGSIFLHAATGLLWRSQAELTKVPKNSRGGLVSATCEVTYTEIVPTLVHEKNADCQLQLAGTEEVLRREVFRLLNWQFMGKVPGR
ncbi:MAG: carboxypeptidase-like regulatory domain-containing protein [Gemmatimonadota bacterium]|nr:carboxypeptidase-like regulatory domain-containing protein [Gemmatimonadota bacterium]